MRLRYCIGNDSIFLISLSLLSVIIIVITYLCDCCSVCRDIRDICISFVSGTIIFVITTTVPRCKQRKDKFSFIKSRVEQIINVGKSLLHNMYSNDELCRDSNIINRIPSDEEIKSICEKRDLRIAPTIYFYAPNEQPSWNLLFRKCQSNLDRSITEMVAIAGQEEINLVARCEYIRKKVEYINVSVSTHLSATPETTEVKGDFLCADMQDLAKQLRKLQERNKWL